MSFHAQNGLHFERLPDGGVRIRQAFAHPDDCLDETLDASSWASVVAAMSAEGETAESFYGALSRQTGQQHDPATGAVRP